MPDHGTRLGGNLMLLFDQLCHLAVVMTLIASLIGLISLRRSHSTILIFLNIFNFELRYSLLEKILKLKLSTKIVSYRYYSTIIRNYGIFRPALGHVSLIILIVYDNDEQKDEESFNPFFCFCVFFLFCIFFPILS